MPEEIFKFSKAYPSDHLRCPDLEGKEVTLTVKSWAYPDVKKDKGSDGKLMNGTVVLFNETPKRFVVNVTNFKTISSMYGSKPDKWIGQKITLYPDTTSFGKDKDLPCIRIRPSNAGSSRPPISPFKQ